MGIQTPNTTHLQPPTTNLIMAQKSIKIVVLFMTMLLCIEFVQARPGPDVYEDYDNFREEVGTGSCTEQRYKQLKRAKDQCIESKENQKLNHLAYFFPKTNDCSLIGPILQCIQPLDECLTTQELNRIKGLILRVAVDLIKYVAGKEAAAKFENCQQYKDLNSK